MRKRLLEIICCPACHNRLDVQVDEEDEIEWFAGQLTCESCGKSYQLKDGMPFLYLDDERWAPKAQEADGWVTIHKNQGIYEQTNPVDFQIPYYPEEPWINVARGFDFALDKLELNGNERILDLGAGRGWAAKHFALRGCEATALDVVPDTSIGLGRGRVLMDDAGVYFDRIIGDGENLPFYDDTFDLVFASGALHHFSDLPLLFQNIRRVLKPNGRLCGINEPCISVADREMNALNRGTMEEVNLGINETRPNLIQYISALESAGLEVSQAYLMGIHDLDGAELDHWKQLNGVSMPPIQFMRPFSMAQIWGKYVIRRGLALIYGEFGQSRQLRATAAEAGLDVDSLIWFGGELFLIAEKPGNTSPRRLIP